jgi:hypothetical protein
MKSKTLRLVLGGTPMKIRRRCLYLLLLWILLCPIGAVGDCPPYEDGNIVFYVTRKTGLPGHCYMRLYGPGPRLSQVIYLNGLQLNVPCRFYAALDRFPFRSPEGKWEIEVWNETITDQFRFCLTRGHGSDIAFEVRAESGSIVIRGSGNRGSGKCGWGGTSSLGFWTQGGADSPAHASSASDSPEASEPNVDVWQFQGTAGDRVTVRLEANTHRGNNPGEVTVRLSGAGRGEHHATGTLPLELTATLDASGTYNINVEQSGENPYSGEYHLSVDSQMGLIDTVEPWNPIEP